MQIPEQLTAVYHISKFHFAQIAMPYETIITWWWWNGERPAQQDKQIGLDAFGHTSAPPMTISFALLKTLICNKSTAWSIGLNFILKACYYSETGTLLIY